MSENHLGEGVAARFDERYARLAGSDVVDPVVDSLADLHGPGLRRLPPGERFQPFDVSPTYLGFDEYDVARQGLVSHHWEKTSSAR